MINYLLLGSIGLLLLLYLKQTYALKKLTKEIHNKRITESNLLLTNPTQSQTMNRLIGELQAVFWELEQTKIVSLQEKNTLDQAIHNITHDIRTPLTIASGYTQQLVKQPNAAPLLAKNILLNLQTITDRLQVLMEYQSLLENNIEKEMQTVNLSETLKAEIIKCYDELKKQQFTVDLQIPDAIFLKTDPNMIERVWQNLLGNILKHGQSMIHVELKEEQEKIQIVFINQVKKPIQQIERLTTRFYSEDLAQSADSSGLGLYIANELVRLLDGRLVLDYKEEYFHVTISFYRE